MDDESMRAADRVVTSTPGPTITILKTANEFTIKGNHLTLIKGNQFDSRIKTDPHKHIHEFLSKTVAFANEGNSNFDTDKSMARTDAMTMKMDARSLPSNTQPNPRGNPSKLYQPPQARNEYVNAVFTRSGKSYDLPTNPNDPQNDSQTPINFDSDDEDEELAPQPEPQTPKTIKEIPTPKPYKLRIPYPQRLRKEKMEAQYEKFLDMIRAV
nr:reverse transcriptase domain-containing protein [Tanacetum cinerariifolium]